MVAVLCVVAAAACGGGDGDLEAFCATAERFATDNPAAAFAAVDINDRAATAAALESAAEDLEDWADDAPGEVEQAVERLASTARDLAGLYGPADVQETDEYVPVDAGAAEEASAEVLRFTREECGVDLDTLDPASSAWG